jgi:hypothetical protein
VTAVLHLLGADSVVGADVVVEDVLACAAAGHVQWVVAGDLSPPLRERLGDRLLPERSPSQQLRDVVVIARLQRLLRELSIRSAGIVVHAHGPAARTVAAFLSAAVIADDGDQRPGHRLLPTPARVVCTSHGDLDRLLDELPARQLVLVPPGIDGGAQRERHERVLLDGVSERVADLLTSSDIVSCDWTAPDAAGARAIVVGGEARCRPALVAAVASGTPCFALDVPWAEDLARCAAFKVVEDADTLSQLIGRSSPRQPRTLSKALGRAARTEALVELLDSLGPPALSRRPLHHRRRH